MCTSLVKDGAVNVALFVIIPLISTSGFGINSIQLERLVQADFDITIDSEVRTLGWFKTC